MTTANMVTMQLGGEVMAIPADCLREILEPVPVTRMPTANRFSVGLVNVRGSVVPLADLKVPFAMAPSETTGDTRFLVLDVRVRGEDITVAIVADKVHDVVEMDPATHEDIPGVGMKWPPEYVRGIGKWQGEFVILPDLETVFSQAIARSAQAGMSEE
jgi:purine-binding chemotaxis protein CheW